MKRWSARDLLTVLLLGLAITAIVVGEYQSAQFLVVMSLLYNISRDVGDIKRRLDGPP